MLTTLLTGRRGGIGRLYGTWQSCRLNNRIKAKQFGNMLGANPNRLPLILTHQSGKSNANTVKQKRSMQVNLSKVDRS